MTSRLSRRAAEGKCRKAEKTGSVGGNVLLPSDNADAYRYHVAAYELEFEPKGLREGELVRSLADIEWRMQRILAIEAAIFARGCEEFAHKFEGLEAAVVTARIEVETRLTYEKPLHELQMQGARLRRQREKDMAELRTLQAQRRQIEASAKSELTGRMASVLQLITREAASTNIFSDVRLQDRKASGRAVKPTHQ